MKHLIVYVAILLVILFTKVSVFGIVSIGLVTLIEACVSDLAIENKTRSDCFFAYCVFFLVWAVL